MLNRRKPSRDGHPAASGRAAAHAALPAHANDAPRSDKHTSNTRIPKSLYNKPTAATAARARNYLTLNALQNGPYCAAKRVVSHCKTGRFTLPNGTYRCPGRYRRPDSHITAKAKCGPPGHTTGCPCNGPRPIATCPVTCCGACSTCRPSSAPAARAHRGQCPGT